MSKMNILKREGGWGLCLSVCLFLFHLTELTVVRSSETAWSLREDKKNQLYYIYLIKEINHDTEGKTLAV